METVASVNETTTNEEVESESIRWKQTPGGVVKTQREDEAISQVFYWAELCDEMIDMPSLGTNIILKEEVMQYGLETLAYWSRWDELSIKDGVLYKKWFQQDCSMPNLLTIVPAAGRNEIFGQFDSMETRGGQLGTEKMLAKIRRRYWWPTMRTDVERKVQWCLSQAAQIASGKRKRAAVQAPIDPGIRFSTMAVDILGPMTMATRVAERNMCLF